MTIERFIIVWEREIAHEADLGTYGEGVDNPTDADAVRIMAEELDAAINEWGGTNGFFTIIARTVHDGSFLLGKDPATFQGAPA